MHKRMDKLRWAWEKGENYPSFSSQAEAESILLDIRDMHLRLLAKAADRSSVFQVDYSPESLIRLESWYFELVKSGGFQEIGIDRVTFELCMDTYEGEVAVRGAGAKWVVQEYAFRRGRYEIGVRLRNVTSMRGRFAHRDKYTQERKRPGRYLYRHYQLFFGTTDLRSDSPGSAARFETQEPHSSKGAPEVRVGSEQKTKRVKKRTPRKPNEARLKMNEALKRVVVSALRKRGFKGSLPHFRRPLPSRVDLLTFQFHPYGGSFAVEIAQCSPGGITRSWGHVPPNKVTTYDCDLAKRPRLLPDGASKSFPWFVFDPPNPRSGSDPYEEIARTVLRIIAERAYAWWDSEKNIDSGSAST